MSISFDVKSLLLPMVIACGLTATLSPLAGQDQTTAPPADRDVADAVVDELYADPAVPGYRVDVVVDDGIVTLVGAVENILAKDRAAAVARTVKGVRSVVNRVEVDPSSAATGSELQADVERALLVDPATDSFEVAVAATDDGAVTLSGTVQSWTERRLCRTVAKGVAGVTEVHDELEVDYALQRADDEIAHEVEQSLRWNALVDDALITTRCNDGVVVLTGTVGSASERVRARNAAWVAGVEDVDASGLQVREWARDEELRGDKYVVRADDQLQAAVEAAMRHDPRVSAFDVTTEVEQAVVTLRGTVDNLKASRAAEADANNTVGVVRVDNRLRVAPSMARSAVETAADVRAALLRDPWVNRFDVTVSVDGGVARLHGLVDSAFERAQADDVAARVDGVVEVDNHIRVSDGSIAVYDPHVDPWPIHGFGWYEYRPHKTFTSDADIRAGIRDQLWWSPFVDSTDIDIDVDDGTVTLSGTVTGRAERMAAVENAYEGGAIWVVDRLRSDQGDAQ